MNLEITVRFALSHHVSDSRVRVEHASYRVRTPSPPCQQTAPPLCFFMSLAEIEEAVDALSPEELTRLAAYIARHDKLAWDEELEEDFSPGGKHEKTLEKTDAEIDSGNFAPLP